MVSWNWDRFLDRLASKLTNTSAGAENETLRRLFTNRRRWHRERGQGPCCRASLARKRTAQRRFGRVRGAGRRRQDQDAVAILLMLRHSRSMLDAGLRWYGDLQAVFRRDGAALAHRHQREFYQSGLHRR